MRTRRILLLVFLVSLLANTAAAAEKEFGQCGSCHSDIAKNYSKSLHYTYRGIENEWAKGMGEDFGVDLLGGCMKCHTHPGGHFTDNVPDTKDCTSCHLESYNEIHDEDEYKMNMTESCLSRCHYKRPGPNYLGMKAYHTEAPNTPADIHYEKGLVCWDCHEADELHRTNPQDRDAPNQRVAVQFTCEDCHNNPGKVVNGMEVTQYSTDIEAHKIHQKELDCAACHAQWYQSCYNCHMDEKMGLSEGDWHPSSGSTTDFYLGVGSNGEVTPFYNMTLEFNGTHVTHWVERSPHTIGEAKDCDFCHGNEDVMVVEGTEGKLMLEGSSFIPEKTASAIYGITGETTPEEETPTTPPTTPEEETTESPGFEIFTAIVGVLVVAYAIRRWR